MNKFINKIKCILWNSRPKILCRKKEGLGTPYSYIFRKYSKIYYTHNINQTHKHTYANFFETSKKISPSKGLKSCKYKILMNFNSLLFRLIQQGVLSLCNTHSQTIRKHLDIADWS